MFGRIGRRECTKRAHGPKQEVEPKTTQKDSENPVLASCGCSIGLSAVGPVSEIGICTVGLSRDLARMVSVGVQCRCQFLVAT